MSKKSKKLAKVGNFSNKNKKVANPTNVLKTENVSKDVVPKTDVSINVPNKEVSKDVVPKTDVSKNVPNKEVSKDVVPKTDVSINVPNKEVSKDVVAAEEKIFKSLLIVQQGVSADVNHAISVILANSVDKRPVNEQEKNPYPKKIISFDYLTINQKKRINRSFVGPYREFEGTGHHSLGYIKKMDAATPSYDIVDIVDVFYANFLKNSLLELNIIDNKGNIVDTQKYKKFQPLLKVNLHQDFLKSNAENKTWTPLNVRTLRSAEYRTKILDYLKNNVSTIKSVPKTFSPQTTEDVQKEIEKLIGLKFKTNPFKLTRMAV